MRRLRIAGIAVGLTAGLLAAGAAAAWHYRTDLVAWAVAAYLKGDDVTAVTLSVIAVEPDRLIIRDIRITGAPRPSEAGVPETTIGSLRADFHFDTVKTGAIDGLTVTDLRLRAGPLPVDFGSLRGNGRFELGFFRLSRFAGGVDLVRMRIGSQRFDPSRIDIDLHDGTLVVDTALTSPDGYVTLLGSGPLDMPAAPFRLLLSGRLNAALLAEITGQTIDAAGHVAFSLSTQMKDPLFFLADRGPDDWPLPGHLTLDGDVRLSLDRLTVNGTALPMAEPDRLRFHFETQRAGPTAATGKFTVGLDAAKRDTAEFGFAQAEARLAGSYDIDGAELALTLDDGSMVRLSEMRLSEGLPVPGDIALQLLGGANAVSLDLEKRTARHAIDTQLSWKAGELSLKSEGHLTDPDDPTIFTLRGAYDTTPLFALSPATKSAKGSANLFLAGRIGQPLLLYNPAHGATGAGPSEAGAAGRHDRFWPGELRLDGAVKLDTEGMNIPGSAATPTAKDSVEVILKGFNGGSGQQAGRIAVNAVISPRQYGGATVGEAKLALEGRIAVGTRGYQFSPGIESVLNIKSLGHATGVVVPKGLNFQLTGNDNHITVPADLSAVYHELTFAHLEADGTVKADGDGKRRPFLVTVPKISSRLGEDGKLAVFLAGGSFELSADHLTGRGLNASLEETAAGIELRLETSEIRHTARPPFTTPIAVNGKGTLKGDLFDATLTAHQRYGPLKVDAAVKHNLMTAAGRLDFTIPRLAFGGKEPALDDTFPITTGWFTAAKGAASAGGHVLWDEDLRSGRMAVEIDKLSVATEDLRLADLTGTVNFIELLPLSMPPRQRLEGTVASGELGPWPMTVEFQLREDGKIDVQDLDIAMAGGVVRTRALIDPAAQNAADGSVQLRAIDLRELLELLGVDGLNGSGRITGTIPVQFRNGQVTVADGLLRAEGPGVLRYSGTGLQEQLATRTDTVGTVAQVLSDFHYKKLSIEMNKAAEGTGVIMLRMDGANPQILEGHPFAFNISIESDFDKLGAIAQGGLKAVGDVIRQTDRPAKTGE
jgi:hypothetical protein